ncbi:MAG: WXG100 family type VII secretion target [Acidimicrobiales bacterium]
MGGFFHASTGTIAQGATDISATMGRIDGLRDDLESTVIRPLQALWLGDASGAWTEVQTEWNQASTAINDLLLRIGQHTGTSAEEFLNAEVSNIATWTR